MDREDRLVLLRRVENVPKHFQEASDFLGTLGLEEYDFFGGALRDHFLGIAHNDIDVLAIFPNYDPFWQRVRTEVNRLPFSAYAGVFRHFISTPLEEVFREKGVECISAARNIDGVFTLKVSFKDAAGQEQFMDLRMISAEQRDRNFYKSVYEAPINSYVLTKNGNLYGDEKSDEHVRDRVFQTRLGISTNRTLKAMMRFVKQAKHIEGLSYVPSERRNFLVSAWKVSQKLTGLPNILAYEFFKLRRMPIRREPS